jgi:hypothetical protein
MLILNPLKKLQKTACENSYQRKTARKMVFLTFITVSKSFLGELFTIFFFHGSELGIKFCV